MTDYILGLDLGPNSIGWALVAAEETEEGLRPIGLLDTESAGHGPLGVRIFEAGLQNFDTGKEESLNQKRREARAARRTIARRRARKRDARLVLRAAGLLPTDSFELERVLGFDPYALRAAALDRKLEPHELGRALMHLATRRGFKSNRLSNDEREEKGLLKEISQLQVQIENAGHRTLGEHLHMQRAAKSGQMPVRLRARQARLDLYADAPRRTRRSMYEEEFKLILERQAQLWGRPPLSEEQADALEKALFFQHPFAVSVERRAKAPSRANLHRAPGVHPCPFEDGETGCPRSDWLAQRFRILKEVQSLRIGEEHQPERALTTEEVQFTVDLLSGNGESSFGSLGKALIKQFGLLEPLEFNLARGGRGKIKGNEVEKTLASAFGKKQWRAKTEAVRHSLRRDLAECTSTEELDRLLEEAGLTDAAKRQKLCKYSPKDAGYLSFSKRALEKILPLMESGAAEHEAIAEVYPDTFEADGMALLPSLVGMQLDKRVLPKIPPKIQNELTNLTNPIVRRALVEVRKVVNAIVRSHGKPVRIVVELAREMKQGKEARKEHSLKLNVRNKIREDARSELRILRDGITPRRSDVDRWLLWKEQRHVCPYCGKGIAAHEVINADVEVDHVLPRWQSLDDSMNNKVLCCGNCNAAKGDRTPMAWLGSDSDRMSALLKRARACVASKANPRGMPFGKIKRFETEVIDTDDFVQSQLNDTRYISKLVASYLCLLFPTEDAIGQKRVKTSRGSMTAKLRYLWGLNGVIPPLVQAHGEVVPGFIEHEGWTEKVRVDHRHHAVDALVVALSSASFVKRLQDLWRRGEDPGEQGASFQPPWGVLRDDAITALEAINVSHRPMRRKRGALHKETFYGAVRGADGERVEGEFVTRKRLDQLTKGMIARIRDHGVREVIEARLKGQGWDGKSSKLPKDWHQEELYLPTAPARPGKTRRSPNPIRRVRVTDTMGNVVQLGDKGHRFAQSGSNFCLQVIESDEEPRTQFRVLSRFDANLPGGVAALPPGQRVVGVLHRKDSVLVRVDGLPMPVLAVVQKLSGPPNSLLDVCFRDAKDSRTATEAAKSPLARVRSRGAWTDVELREATVDPLGRIAAGKFLSLESSNGAQADS